MSVASVRALLDPQDRTSLAAPAAASWGDLRLRVLSAAVLAPVALLCVWFGGLAWQVLIGVVVAGLAVEWVQLSRRAWPLSAVLAGVAYVILAGAALIWLRRDPLSGRADMLCVILAVWATDIGAYVAGRWFGGRRLAPSISPGKTWSGAAGGLATATVLGVAALALLGAAPGARAALLFAALSVVSQAGDLAESAMKRRFGVKDSSHLIPGHGGLLDRLDGMLAAAPAAALLAVYLGPGVPLWQ